MDRPRTDFPAGRIERITTVNGWSLALDDFIEARWSLALRRLARHYNRLKPGFHLGTPPIEINLRPSFTLESL